MEGRIFYIYNMRKEIIELYMNGGLSYNEIAKKLGCSKSAVAYHCLRLKNGVISSKTDFLKINILKLRNEGKSYNEISEFLKCSKSTISHHCNNNNLSDIGLDEIKRIKRGSKICENCGVEFSLTGIAKGRKFCNKDCYNKSDQLKELGRKSGLKSSQSQKENRRSKNEIYFYDLCKKKYDEVLNNESIFNGWDADVIITKYKIVILWNGVWHYKKITKKHSIKQVENRDIIKIKEIKNCGYTPYIIKDMGRENKQFVEIEFEKLTGYISSLS